MGLKAKAEDVEAKYDVTLNYPNLELHSAAASGNVGLVHYALTHGQPVNSVLHGVLPIHAACSGGSVSVVKMLIERGADVNAPRLPRRYSDGKKSNVPSIGAAGSTPLHFAAANGHAGLVQILLTCGAIPYKSDKNGMTPETLAEINNHTDVIRVLRVWEHLKATDPTMSVADGSSYQVSEADEDESRHGSMSTRKGKERAFSFASNVSDSTTGQAVRLKQSLEGMFLRGRSSRSGSIVSTRPEIPSPLTGLDHLSGSAIQDEASPIEPSETPSAAMPEGTGADEEANTGEELDRVKSAASGSSQPPPLVRITSENSDEAEELPVSPRKATLDHLGPAPSRHNPSTSGSSRRPSLPSIFEKAAHPGAAFRAALRREHKDHHIAPLQAISPTTSTFEDSSSPTSAPTSAESSHGHGFFRGRRDSSKSKHGHNKYMSKHALLHLFKRSHSPPSRSPSPPRRVGTTKPIDNEQIEEGIEKMRRASLDLDLRQSTSIGSDEGVSLRMPVSAPPTKTTFFVDSIVPPPIQPIDPASIPLPPTPTPRAPSSPNVRRTRSRQSSDVIAPSPLANEWATSSDSDTPRSIGIRRAKTEVIKSSTLSQLGSPRVALQDHRTNPPSPLRLPTTRSRAVTSPSTPVGSVMRSASGTKLAGMGWGDPIDLRKVASLRHESMHRMSRRYTNSDLEAFRKSEFEDKNDHDEAGDADGEVDDEDGSTPQASQLNTTPTRSDPADESKASQSTSEERPGSNGRPALTIAITEPSYVDLADPPGPRQQGRYRGASIGSMSATTDSSRVSTPPGSSLRMSLLTSDEESRSPTYASYTYDAKSMMPPPPPPSSTGSAGRARGKSVSSTSSIPSDMSLSYFNTSTPGTSLTPQSTLSMSRFPPVPEHAVAHHPANRRKVSNRAEAREAKQQAEDDVLQLAQLPVSLDSSRSLAAQLAAYGESVAVEKKFAKREKMDGSEMSYSGSAMSGRSGRSGQSAMSASETEAESWFSANSGGGSSGEGTTSTRARSRRKPVQPMADIPPSLLPPANAPKSSLSSIDQIYDKRAAAYRDRMAALTALPPSFPSSLSSTHRTPRPRTASNESWLTGGASSRQPGWLTPGGESVNIDPRYAGAAPSFVSAAESLAPPTHAHTHAHSHRSKKAGGPVGVGSIRSASGTSAKAASMSLGTASQSLHSSLPPVRAGSTHTRPKSTAPAPIADVISTRYAGMSPPPNVPQPPRLDPSSPYVSIFSHRYSGQPHDGDDSDDDEQTGTALTVVENDWRATRGIPADEGFERKGRWGQFKGAIGKVGHRKA